MALKLRQGLATDRTSITPVSGELIYTTDTKRVYVGDGTTPGGNLLTSGGGGGGSMNSFSVSGDDSASFTVNDGDILEINGAGDISVSVVAGKIVINSSSSGTVNTGVANRLAWYDTSSNSVTDNQYVLFDPTTNTLDVVALSANAIFSDHPDFSIINTLDGNVTFGGTYQTVEYSGRINVFDVSGYDPAFPITSSFKQVHDDASANAVTFTRSRGTLAAEAKVQAGDILGSIVFAGYNGSVGIPSVRMRSGVYVTPPDDAPVIAASIGIETTNYYEPGFLGVVEFDPDQFTNFYGSVRQVPQTVDMTTGNVQLYRTQNNLAPGGPEIGLRSNILICTLDVSNRTLILPNATAPGMAGMRILVINTHPSLDTLITDAGSNPIDTAYGGGTTIFSEILCTGSDWLVLAAGQP